MTQGTQNTIVATDLPSFPWVHGDKLYAVPMNNEIIALQNQISNMANQISILQVATDTTNLGVSITVSWGGGEMINPGTYVLTGSAPYDFTITSLLASNGTNGGFYFITVLVDGAFQSHLTGLGVIRTSIEFGPAHSVIPAGSNLSILISNVIGTPLNAWLTIKGTTNAVPTPVIGVTVGTAHGVSQVSAVGRGLPTNQALAAASGAATTTFFGMAAAQMVGQASGVASVTAAGVGLTIGSRVANAAGTSTANAVGASTTSFPTLVLNDPVAGILDQNPLG